MKLFEINERFSEPHQIFTLSNAIHGWADNNTIDEIGLQLFELE